jgi:hypothetical protein
MGATEGNRHEWLGLQLYKQKKNFIPQALYDDSVIQEQFQNY